MICFGIVLFLFGRAGSERRSTVAGWRLLRSRTDRQGLPTLRNPVKRWVQNVFQSFLVVLVRDEGGPWSSV
ncbi:hypothetical protein PR003_g11336 [Phytophthora rubi]|uniref:Secreted protein n=1 Tax=Phytophthora rubi TaxID=129364 RepID=A0A6A4F3C3_9STRA|nr:hypothetical protein PR003_g11336 [Phytophthora rubi]